MNQQSPSAIEVSVNHSWRYHWNREGTLTLGFGECCTSGEVPVEPPVKGR